VVPYEQANNAHFLVGLGADYMFKRGLGLRAEFISYEGDINYGQVALLFRFGKQRRRKVIENVVAREPVQEPPVIAKPAPEPVLSAAVKEPKVNPCDRLKGVMEGVNFHSNSAELTRESIGILRSAANVLIRCKSKTITVAAHTDSVGDAVFNETLSAKRARSVVNFFVRQGISRHRLVPSAFGETSPIDTNSTKEGRRRNRRVELLLN